MNRIFLSIVSLTFGLVACSNIQSREPAQTQVTEFSRNSEKPETSSSNFNSCDSNNYLDSKVKLVQESLSAIDKDYNSGKISKDDVRFALREMKNHLSPLEKCRPAAYKKIVDQVSTAYGNL